MSDRAAPAESQPDPLGGDTSGPSVQRATNDDTGLTQNAVEPTVTVSSPTPRRTPRSEPAGSAPTDSESGSTSPTSAPFAPPSRHWKTPRNARDFAAQANTVATMILNGDLDIDIARAYTAAARTSAQMLTAEVQRARFLRTEPNLDLSLEDDDDDTAGT
jgi:hypothetical protein